MRIGIDARLNHYRPGGSAEYTRHLILELGKLDQANQYFILHHAKGQETYTPGPNFRRVNLYTPCHHRLERWSLSAEIARLRLDVLHSPDAIPPAFGAQRRITTIHDLHYLYYPQFMTADSRRYYNDQIAWAVKTADHILVSSHSTQHDLMELLHVPADKMTVHVLGVNEIFHPQPPDIVQVCRVKYHLPKSYILFVGTFEPRKNLPGLFEAYHLLRQDIPDLPPLVLAGRRGWLYDDIFAKAEELKLHDCLIWLENLPTDDLPALYTGADMLVLPSHYEGFGLPALEAMACGTVPVASNRSSLPEVVGDGGLLIEPDDPAAIAEAIRRILFDPALRDQLRQKGLAQAARFTWEQTARSALAVYGS
jgi:glycosyltransferase involved in cell wall biosynthesis